MNGLLVRYCMYWWRRMFWRFWWKFCWIWFVLKKSCWVMNVWIVWWWCWFVKVLIYFMRNEMRSCFGICLVNLLVFFCVLCVFMGVLLLFFIFCFRLFVGFNGFEYCIEWVDFLLLWFVGWLWVGSLSWLWVCLIDWMVSWFVVIWFNWFVDFVLE